MFYVYILNSEINKNRMYVGFTLNLENRLKEHNAGECSYTAQYRPWKLCTYHYFDNEAKALAFEKYLKSGSGRAFSKKHF